MLPRRRALRDLPGCCYVLPVDALVTHIEVNGRHGVGQLLGTLFGDGPELVVIRSRTHFGGEHSLPGRALRLKHGRQPRPLVRARVAWALRGLEVRRVLCVPYYPDDVRTALALAEGRGLPLATWLMDDQNLASPGIPDDLMAALLRRSRLRLAISPELRDGYVAKYGLSFGFAPPLVPGRLLRPPGEPVDLAPDARGLVIGNIWGQRWYQGLRRAVRGAGLSLDWSSPAGVRAYWDGLDPVALAANGITALGALPETEFVARLRAAPFVVVPSGTLDADDDHASLSRYSLPSRIVFAMAVAHVPIVVLGSPETAAARFVSRAGLGVVAPYEPEALRAAVVQVTAPTARRQVAARAAALAPAVSADGGRDWLWRSLQEGRPSDGRFERLLDTATPHRGPGDDLDPPASRSTDD
jgi:hypothetical protein